MTKAFLSALCGALLFALPAIPTRGAEHKSQPYVVVVGVGEYADPQIKPRPHAETDAVALYDLFTDAHYLGADQDHVRLLLGKTDAKRHSVQATHENILNALRWVASRASKDDLVILAMVGEGAPLNERACYFASDSTFKERAKNAVATSDMEHALEKLRSQRLLVLMDVNFKGFDTGKEPAPELNLQNFLQMKEFLGEDEESPAIGRVILLSTRGFTPTIELPQHGLFTKVLLDALSGAADREGYEPDGAVTTDEVIEYLDKELPRLTEKFGKTREEKLYTHLVFQGESSHFVVTHNPAAAPKAQERNAHLEKLADEQKITALEAEQGRKLLERMPKLESFRGLRKVYESLADGKTGVEEFRQERARVLDGMKLSRSAAMDYAAKVIQATQIIGSEYVKEVTQADLVTWGIKGLYQRTEEKLPAELKQRVDSDKTLNEEDLTRLLADARQHLGHRDDLDNHKDLDFTLQRMLTHLDPYTTYIDPEALQRFKQDTSGNFTGIGVQIRKDTTRDMLQVVTPIKDSPAYRAGIKAGDTITEIIRDTDARGRHLPEPEVTSTKGMSLSDAVKKILGRPGTPVAITVERDGEPKPLHFDLTRALVKMESVLGVKRRPDDGWDYLLDADNRIGYVRLTNFADETYNDLRKALVQMQRGGGIRGLVLDLRFNPGGLLTSAVQISDLFIDDGLIVTIRNRAGQEAPYSGESEGSLLDFPMVVLINGGSASASEIVSACLQDHKRALLIGERSYGKGSVQNLQSFEGGKLKLTTASYWRPSGKNIHRFPHAKETDEWGVTPDKGVKLSRKEREELVEAQHNQEIIPRRDAPPKEPLPAYKDRQLETGLDYLRGQIKTASRDPTKKAG